jgi:shikimate kinase
LENSDETPSTISLIGMPGAGKSTVGVLLAKLAGLQFRDTDLDIQLRAGKTLQQILERDGHIHLRALEEQVLMEVPLARAVISTGGSVVYSELIMQRLCDAGPVVYLEADFETLQKRVAAAPPRGMASGSHHSFKDIFDERTPMYRTYANFTVRSDKDTADQIAAQILKLVQG